jgi:hypothetical protein
LQPIRANAALRIRIDFFIFSFCFLNLFRVDPKLGGSGRITNAVIPSFSLGQTPYLIHEQRLD